MVDCSLPLRALGSRKAEVGVKLILDALDLLVEALHLGLDGTHVDRVGLGERC